MGSVISIFTDATEWLGNLGDPFKGGTTIKTNYNWLIFILIIAIIIFIIIY